MSTIVLDASVAVKLVSEEPDSQIALERIATASRIVAPDWMILEAAHALWKKSRLSSLNEVQARTGIDALRQIVDTFVPATTLISRAMALAFDLPHPIYDCLYLALAEDQDAIVLTADARFVDRARQAGCGCRFDLLEGK